MATNDYGDLQARVARRLIDAPQMVTDEVPRLVLQSIRNLQDRHNFWVMKGLISAQSTTYDEHVLRAKPTTWKGWRDFPYYLSEDPVRQYPIKVAPNLSAIHAQSNWDDYDHPRWLVLSEEPTEAGVQNIEVYPRPDQNSDWSDGEYRVYIPYWRYLADVSADSDTNWLTVYGNQFIEADATAAGFMLDWDEERAGLWEKKAEMAFKQLLKNDAMQVLAGMETLVPYDGTPTRPMISN